MTACIHPIFLLVLQGSFMQAGAILLLQERSDWPCPEAVDIAPCVCSVDHVSAQLHMDCSAVADDAELARAFQAKFLFSDFDSLTINGSTDRVGISRITPSTFGSVSFKHIQVTHTNLSLIETTTFTNSFPTLQTMDFSDNQLVLFPFDTLPECPLITSVTVSNNHLVHMSHIKSTSLEILKVCHNLRLRYESGVFHGAPKLKEIHMCDIGLTYIAPDTFSSQKQLEVIKLRGNEVDVLVADSFKLTSSSPVNVNLDFNAIATVEPLAFNGLQQGTKLRLNNNTLTQLDQAVWEDVFKAVEGPGGVELIEMAGNSVACDCSIKWLVSDEVHLAAVKPGLECDDGQLLHDPNVVDFILEHC